MRVPALSLGIMLKPFQVGTIKKSSMVFVDCQLFTNFAATKQVVLGFDVLTGLLVAIWRTEN